MVLSSINTQPRPFTAPAFKWPQQLQTGLADVEATLVEPAVGEQDVLTAAAGQLFAAGGKRIRPRLCLLVAGLFEVDYQRAVSLAAGIEMLHTATLVHDDVIDGALVRRGVPTLNADWSLDASMMVGDYLFARAAYLVAQTGNVRVMELFAQTLMVIINGEIAQRSTKWQIDRQEYYERIYAKTAAMFVLAAQAAAELGDADEDSMQALVGFGHYAGMAFQIVDDVLDFIGTAEQIGKPTGSDLEQGLFTLPAIYYHEAYPNDSELSEYLAAQDGDHPLLSQILEKIRCSAAIEASLSEAWGFVARAQNALDMLPHSMYDDSTYVDSLSVLVRAVLERHV